MKLKEFESKPLLKKYGIKVPNSIIVHNRDINTDYNTKNKVIKAQILSNGRAKNGAILFPKSSAEGKKKMLSLFNSKILGEDVNEILIEEKIDFKKEYYISLLFDSYERSLLLILSRSGGVDIEIVPENDIYKFKIDIIEGIDLFRAREFSIEAGFKGKEILLISNEILKLYRCFIENDVKMVEINPLVITNNSEVVALDCVMVLDDDALKRQNFNFPMRNGTLEKTALELEASLIDEGDYRGVCGRTFIELDGDIAILSSGGGASITAIDSVILHGGKPANFTEYSGNPPAEKVSLLTKVILKKKGLNGIFIVGGRANFTRVDVTLKAIIDEIVKEDLHIPILIRRAGPGFEEALDYIEKIKTKKNLNIKVYDDSIPISVASKEIVEASANYYIKKMEGGL